MKQLKLILSVACAVAIVAPAFATKLSVSGGGNARFGYESKKVGSTTTKSQGMQRDGDVMKITFSVASDDDKLTAAGQTRWYSGSAGATGEGWIQYDFGTVALKYNPNGLQNAWDSDLLFIHDGQSSGFATGNQSFNIAIKAADTASVFVTLIQLGNGYPDTKTTRSLPIIQAGANITAGALSATVGGAFDSHKKPLTNEGAKKTSTLFFGKVTFKASDALSAFVSGAYGSNYGTFAAEVGDSLCGVTEAEQTNAVGGGTASVMTFRAGADFSVDADNTVGGQFKYGSLKGASKKTSSAWLAEAYFKHAFSANFAVKPGFDYSSAKNGLTTVKYKDTHVWVNAEYSF